MPDLIVKINGYPIDYAFVSDKTRIRKGNKELAVILHGFTYWISEQFLEERDG